MAYCWKLVRVDPKGAAPAVWAKMISRGTAGGWSSVREPIFSSCQKPDQRIAMMLFFGNPGCLKIWGKTWDHHIWSWKTKSRQFISHICPFILAITWSNPQGSVPKPSMESSVFFRKAKAHGRETSFAHHLHTHTHSQPHLSVFFLIYDYIYMASW